jgi:hypothetical protein
MCCPGWSGGGWPKDHYPGQPTAGAGLAAPMGGSLRSAAVGAADGEDAAASGEGGKRCLFEVVQVNAAIRPTAQREREAFLGGAAWGDL